MRQAFLLAVFLCLFGATSVYSADIITADKLITVDVGRQELTAWEGGKIVHQTKVSTGLAKTPTVKGSFRVRWKRPSQTMRGESKWYGRYEYKNVPHVMYFYQDYAIHGAYWHNRFGRVASHGCVNTPLASAEWLYNWAPPGTRVEVY